MAASLVVYQSLNNLKKRSIKYYNPHEIFHACSFPVSIDHDNLNVKAFYIMQLRKSNKFVEKCMTELI